MRLRHRLRTPMFEIGRAEQATVRILRALACPGFTTTFEFVKVEKPSRVIVTSYVPPWTVGKLYAPESFVNASRVWLVSLFVIVTLAPAMAALLGSVTLPTSDP